MMTPKSGNTNSFPQEALDLKAQKELLLVDLSLPNEDGFNVLKRVVNVFQDDLLEPVETSATKDEPSYKVLTRTLNDETFVQLRWGVSKDKTCTVADVEIDGGRGKSKLTVSLSQATKECVIEYGTTVAGEGPSSIPKKDKELSLAFVKKAHELLVKKDATKPPEASVAIASLDARRQTKRKK